jgi:hypothetical protein
MLIAGSFRKSCNEDDQLKSRKEPTEARSPWSSIDIHVSGVINKVMAPLSACMLSKVPGSGDSGTLTANTIMHLESTIYIPPIHSEKDLHEGGRRPNDAPVETGWIRGTGAIAR